MKLLIINPGSTSTKISVFEDDRELFEESIFHDAPELLRYPSVNDQVPFRKAVILETMAKHGITPDMIDVFVGRGGSAQPQSSGVTEIDQKLFDDTKAGIGGSEHPAKLGVMLAWELGCEFGGRMLTMDPTNVDELCDLARLTGIRHVYRNAQSHVLNQKAVARAHARKLGRKYADLDLIVCHIDGGITVNAHHNGAMIDGNVGSGGDGSYTPTRIGTIPILPLLDYIDAHSVDDVRRMCSRSGGFVSHFGTADADIVHKLVDAGDTRAKRVWDAMVYQICKEIGSMACVLNGKVDAILLTGGLVRFDDIVEGIRARCGWIAPIELYPGEMEQEALMRGAMRVIRGEEQAKIYSGAPVWQGFPDD